jgi:ATP-binding cassette subfamily B protein
VRVTLDPRNPRLVKISDSKPASPAPRSTTEEAVNNRQLLVRLVGLAWRYRFHSLAVVGLNMLLVAASLSTLGLTGLSVDVLRQQVDATAAAPHWPFGLTPPTDWSGRQQVLLLAGLVLGFAALNAFLRYVATVSASDLTQKIVIQLRSDVYAKLQRLSFRFYDSNDSSSIINRTAGDVQSVRAFVDGVIIKVLTVALTLVVYLGYMLSMHVPLTIVCLATTPLLWVGAAIFSRKVQPAYREGSELVDEMILTLAENVQGQQVVKGFAREPEEVAKFAAANRRIRDQKDRIFWIISTFQPVMGLLTQLNMLILIGYGGYLVINGQLMLGAGLFVFSNLLHEFANQVGQITNVANTIQSSLIAARRVFEVLDADEEVVSPAQPVALPRARGAIRFDRVSFAYNAGETVLSDVSFEVRPGECLGIVGETGAGKTTLLNLISRFYDATSGTVSIDGIDVRRLHVDEHRRNLGLVFQEAFLFSHTVAANISFGRPDATPEEIERAARLASAHEFIDGLPDRYDTVIGEHGCNLSGGQRQRLSIARAMLLDPPILIMDDATAAVDSETEHEIRDAVEGAMSGRTSIIVSNRLSSLRRADRILVLQGGRVTHQGAHEQLLRVCPSYRRLAELQFAQQFDDATIPASEPKAPSSRNVFVTSQSGGMN